MKLRNIKLRVKPKIRYEDLENHFTKSFLPTEIKRIPRKIKKRFKSIFYEHYDYEYSRLSTPGEFRWEMLEYIHPDYKRFLIKCICTEDN